MLMGPLVLPKQTQDELAAEEACVHGCGIDQEMMRNERDDEELGPRGETLAGVLSVHASMFTSTPLKSLEGSRTLSLGTSLPWYMLSGVAGCCGCWARSLLSRLEALMVRLFGASWLRLQVD